MSSAGLKGLTTALRAWIVAHGKPAAEKLTRDLGAATPGSTVYSGGDMRIDAGHPDHDDPKLKHVVLQINAKPQNATLKSAIANKRGTHTKVATFALDTTAEITKDLLEAKIFGEK